MLLFLPFAAHASEAYDSKPLQIGFGTYAVVVAYDAPYLANDELSGTTLAIRAAVTDNFAFHANFYSTTHDTFSSIDSSGSDISVYFGRRLKYTGFKVYGGGGIFNDTWELSGYDVKFNGIQLSGGIGYNWEHISVEFILSLRDSSDYEQFIYDTLNTHVTAAAATGSLLVSARF
ncbi:MAG: hypothetical protein OQK76_09215 [Gammaproteobacteria bacterium]|nr:hypothetical protein [Gammaproteobacteria bacterium]